jgi:uncharacterized membrane protein required for colicin V production
MNVIDIIVIIILVFSFLGGLKEGAVKTLSSLVALIIAIPVTTFTYGLLTALLSFLPGEDWQNFFGFFITMGIISVGLHLVFFIPRKIIGSVWKEGILYRLLGGVFNVIGGMIGFVVFTLLVQAYPIFGFLEEWVTESDVLTALVNVFSFIRIMLPEALKAGITV